MHKMDCKNCVYARKHKDGEAVPFGKNGVVVMNGGGFTCTTNVKEMSIDSNGLCCSEFKPVIHGEGNVT